jgi:hypothetical protein
MLDDEPTQKTVIEEFALPGRDIDALLNSMDEFVQLYERVEKTEAEGGDAGSSQTVEKIKALARRLQQDTR